MPQPPTTPPPRAPPARAALGAGRARVVSALPPPASSLPPMPQPRTSSSPADVELRDVVKTFGDVAAVDHIDLVVPPGEFLALLGPSGCGKTTTLRIIAGFEQPTAGEVLVAGKSMLGVPPHRREVNTVFQHYALF